MDGTPRAGLLTAVHARWELPTCLWRQRSYNPIRTSGNKCCSGHLLKYSEESKNTKGLILFKPGNQ